MGATNFTTVALGRDVTEAFRKGAEAEAWEHGHGGYSGTLAEKPGAVLIGSTGQPDRIERLIGEAEGGKYVQGKNGKYHEVKGSREKASRALAAWLKAHGTSRGQTLGPSGVVETYNDKWGIAVAIEVTGAQAARVRSARGRKGTRDKVFLFTGYASC